MTWIVVAATDTNFVQDYGNLIASIVLIAVTGWYAYLTKRLADSAKESAQSAKDAAQASERAVQIAESNVRLDLSINSVMRAIEAPEQGVVWVVAGARMQCNGAAMNIHGATLDSVEEWVQPKASREIAMGDQLDVASGSLPGAPSIPFPVRIHNGETLFLRRAEHLTTGPNKVVAMTVTVHYTLDESSDPKPLRVHWRSSYPTAYDTDEQTVQ